MQAPKENVLLHLQRQANSNINWLNFLLSLSPLSSTNGFIYALKKAILFHLQTRVNSNCYFYPFIVIITIINTVFLLFTIAIVYIPLNFYCFNLIS